MFVKKKKNRSGTTSVVVAEKSKGSYRELKTIGVSSDESKIEVRPMFHFTRRCIEAHVCICFVALKVYKELERRLKRSNIRMSVDKVLAMTQTVTTIEIKLPLNKNVI